MMTTKHIAIATLSSLIFGMNVVASKFGVEHFPPLFFSALRFLCVTPLVFLLPRPKVAFSGLLALSMAWGAVYIGGLNLALAMGLSAGTAVLILQLGNLVTMIAGYYVFSTQPQASQIVGTCIALVGIAFVCLVPDYECNLIAFCTILIAALSYSMGVIICKKLHAEPVSLNVWVAALSFLPIFILSLIFEGDPVSITLHANLQAWVSVIFAGLISTFLGGILWAYVIRQCDISHVVPFRLLIPVFGLWFSALFLNESLLWQKVVGAGLVIGGLAIAQFSGILSSKLQILKVKPFSLIAILAMSLSILTGTVFAESPKVIPVAVIGSGCAGLSAAYVTGEEGIETVVFEGPKLGGDLNVKTIVGNWMAVSTKYGNKIMPDVIDKAKKYGARFVGTGIVSVDFSKVPYVLVDSKGDRYLANKVVIATGTKEKTWDVPGTQECKDNIYHNSNVYDDYSKFKKDMRGKSVAIVGGAVDAMKKAAYAYMAGAKEVRIFVRGDRLRLPEWRQKYLDKLSAKVSIQHEQTVEKVNSLADGKVRLCFHNGGTYDADKVIVSIGRESRSEVFKPYLETNKRGQIVVNGKTLKTSVPGVYACGDVTDAVGPEPQAMIAAGQGMMAGYMIVQDIKKVQP